MAASFHLPRQMFQDDVAIKSFFFFFLNKVEMDANQKSSNNKGKE